MPEAEFIAKLHATNTAAQRAKEKAVHG